MAKKTKAFLYNFFAFTVFYIPTMILLKTFAHLDGFVLSMTAFVISLVLSPKFQFMVTNEGEKIFMKWIFKKGIQEVK